MRRFPNPRAWLRGFCFLIALSLAAAGCSRGTPEPYIIGHLAPRSGPDQATGLRDGEAVSMVVGDVTVSDEMRIDRRPVTVILGDTGADPEGFAYQATRLLAVNRV